MLKLNRKARILLLIALAVFANSSPVLAQTDVKPSRPLNLLRTKRAMGLHNQPLGRTPADSRTKASTSDNATPLITGAVPAADNAATAAGRPGKTGNATAPAKPTRSPPNISDNEVAQFCNNVADAALDSRLAWQMKELEQAEKQLRERIAEVEAKRAEYEKWMSLRDEFLKKAEAGMVEVFSRMRPEAAATQISAMADDTAAAVLAKLSARSSSAIFNEMEPARAAQLADLLGGMRRVDDGKTSK